MTRHELTEQIILARLKKGLTWAQLAEVVGQSPVWTTAALLGQMPLNKQQAVAAVEALGLDEEAVMLLQVVPYRGSLEAIVPTDPTMYRFYEIISVYGTAIKELIHEEFGDGIMSAIDFEMKIERQPDPKGDRVKVSMNGKFLPYKVWVSLTSFQFPDRQLYPVVALLKMLFVRVVAVCYFFMQGRLLRQFTAAP